MADSQISHDTMASQEAVQQQSTNDEALLATMRARFMQCEEFERTSRNEELIDLRFANGYQWESELQASRDASDRPSLVINQMPQFIRQVTNEERQNRPQIKVRPVDGNADVETARIIQGLIRQIEADSDADVAYDTAFEAAVRSGKGYWRVLTEYESDTSFDLVIKIKRIRNRFTVFFDPYCQQPDGSDARWAMIIERWPREEFCAEYPNSTPHIMQGWTSQGDGWVQRNDVRVAEYFYKETRLQDIVLTEDGAVFPKDAAPSSVRVVAERKAHVPEIHWVKTNGYDVLERNRFPGDYIPIVPCIGDEMDINGEVRYSGIVRHARDAQRQYNYWSSSATETVALAPKAPWLLAEGQIGEYSAIWRTANTQNHSYLPYKPTSHGTELVPPPRRIIEEPPILAITQAQMLSRQDMNNTTGIYPPVGMPQTQPQSGRAKIMDRQNTEISNFHYIDNLARSQRHTGRIVLSMIPHVYSARRVVRILGEDGTSEQVTLNAPFQDAKGMQQLYRPTVGRYDVVMDTGPSYTTQRQETVATMLDLAGIAPELMQVAGHILLKNMDWPGAQEIARLWAIHTGNLSPEDAESPEAQFQQLQAMVPQLQQQIEAMNAYAQQCETQMEEAQVENTKLSLQLQNKQGELEVKEAETASNAAADAAKTQIDQQKVIIDQQKLELDEQRLALEVAKAQTEMTESQARLAGITEQTAMVQTLQTQLSQVSAQMQAMMGELRQTQEALLETEAARLGEKQISVTRDASGRVVSTVTAPGQPDRIIELTPTANGYVGEVEAAHTNGVAHGE